MSISRPLPKELLKKMFLKVLYEHQRPRGRYARRDRLIPGSMDYTCIMGDKIPEFFKISGLSEDEYAQGIRAVHELERDDYIMQHPKQLRKNIKVLTEKGLRIVTQELEDMKLSSMDIDQLLTRDGLREKIHDDYLSEDYETAISKAFKLLEETVRSKAKQSPEVYGADLMSKAFSPKGGLLKHPDAQTPGEIKALHHLMRGAIMWFKNPSSHRTVRYDAEKAAQVLAFANLLLDMVDKC